MVIPMQGRRPRFAGAGLDDFANYVKSTVSDVAGDKGVKAAVVAQAIASVTGIAPVVDTRDPQVTWVRTVPGHSKWIESVFVKAVTKNPNARPADLKVDIFPALNPILLKRFLPVLALVGAGVFAAGYFVGKD
jgi:hypothetical protein